MVDSGRFSGDWAFLVKAKGSVLHPPEGTMVDVEILKNNKMGIYAEYENAIRIMVPRDLHLGDEEFDRLKVGERITVEIQKSRFQLKDPFIVSVGVFRGRSGAPTQVVPRPPRNTPSAGAAAAVAGPLGGEVDEDAAEVAGAKLAEGLPAADAVAAPVAADAEDASGAEEEEE
jgi:hypothetical protein